MQKTLEEEILRLLMDKVCTPGENDHESVWVLGEGGGKIDCMKCSQVTERLIDIIELWLILAGAVTTAAGGQCETVTERTEWKPNEFGNGVKIIW